VLDGNIVVSTPESSAMIPGGTPFRLDYPEPGVLTLTPERGQRLTLRVGGREYVVRRFVYRGRPDRTVAVEVTASVPPDVQYALNVLAVRVVRRMLRESSGEYTPEVGQRVRDIIGASEHANDFWRGVFRRAGYTWHYRSPSDVVMDATVQPDIGLWSRGQIVIGLSPETEFRPSRGLVLLVMAHEWGHHVQALLRTPSGGVPLRLNPGVRTELQADCYAGAWLRQAMDDDLVTGREVLTAFAWLADFPPSATHGTPEQRLRALQRGLSGAQPDPLARCALR
jgi:hypothetical protein